MSNLIEDFLNETAIQISDLELCPSVLEKNPDQEDCWDALYVFFDFVRSVSPFAGFMRSYRLSDAAVKEIREYKKNKKSSDFLPAVLAKYRRVCEILSAAERLKREARGTDEDILFVPTEEKKRELPSSAPKEKNIGVVDLTAQEKALDKKEEELILWAQALAEQENALKDKENILFKEENIQEKAREQVQEVAEKLKEKEKIQSELEECLAETRLSLEMYQKKLEERESLQAQSVRLLETKDAALNEMSRKIIEMRQHMEKQSALAELREDEISRELQERLRQNEELKKNLKSLENTYSNTDKERSKIYSEYASLEKEFQNVSLALENEREDKTLLLQEKRALEKQHLEFTSRLISLQDDFAVEQEKLKRMEALLADQKSLNEEIQSELNASGWPYDSDKYQKDLALLSGQRGAKPPVDSLLAFEQLLHQTRTRSLVRLSEYFRKRAQEAAQRYRRGYKIKADCQVSEGIDIGARDALEQLLFQLLDNSFKYAVPQDGGALRLFFSAREDGLFIRCRFSDNGDAFDFDKLHKEVQSKNLISKNISLSRSELLAYLFHNAVEGEKENRGLLSAVRSLERAGGQISADFNDGLQIDFCMPKRFLYGKVLLFRLSSRLLAIPMTAVAETVVLKEGDILPDKNNGHAFFYLKGDSIPVLIMDNNEQNGFGLVVKAGAFKFLMPVQQILDTEYLADFAGQNEENQCLVPCTVLESGQKPLWLDISGLVRQTVLPLPRKVVSFSQQVQNHEKATESYLIYKSEPNIFGAVKIDSVLKVEDFVLLSEQFMRKKSWETEGKKLPLKDSCPRAGYPHAQTVLIFEKFAMTVYEVADIIEVSDVNPQKGQPDFIVYSGRKVPVLKIDD